jgi:ABC-type transporter Mla subunit MlaD
MFYKLCVAPAGLPANLDAHFTYVSSAELTVASSSPPPPPSPPPSMEALTQQIAALAANVAAQSSALSTQSSTLSTLSANVAAQSSTLSTLSGNVAALSAALSCGAGGRRLETDASSAPSVPSESTTAQTIVDDFLSRRPDLAGTLTAEQRAGMEELGQHFGVPALA